MKKIRAYFRKKKEDQFHRCIKKLKKRVRELEAREELLKKYIKNSINKAHKHNAEDDKHGVIYEMKRKSAYEREIRLSRSQKMNVEKQKTHTERAFQNFQTLHQMRKSNDLLGDLHAQQEDVHEFMTDLEQSQLLVNEVDKMLGKKIENEVDTNNEEDDENDMHLYDEFLRSTGLIQQNDIEDNEMKEDIPEYPEAWSMERQFSEDSELELMRLNQIMDICHEPDMPNIVIPESKVVDKEKSEIKEKKKKDLKDERMKSVLMDC